jgi:hypothetical protein
MTEAQLRQGTKFVAAIPREAGKVVSMAVYGAASRIIVACEFGVYELIEAAYPEPRKIREVLCLIPEVSDG